jgi:hypothetical protein
MKKYNLDENALFFNYKNKYIQIIKQKEYVNEYTDPFDKVIRDGLTSIAKNKIDEQIKIIKRKHYLNPNYDHLSPEVIEKCSKISLVTSCMNRNEFLKLSLLKSWVLFPFKEIIIVDWSSKEDVSLDLRYGMIDVGVDSSKCQAFLDAHNIDILKVRDKKLYNHSEVRNYKVKHSTSDWILCIDADVMLTTDFLSTLELTDENVYYINKSLKSDRGLFGTSLFSRKLYDEVGGFDEEIKYWGSEDSQFYERADKLGYKPADIRSYTMYHQPHDDKLRVENTPVNDIYDSLTINNYKIAKKTYIE